MKGLYFLIWTQLPNMKTSAHDGDQMDFLDFTAKSKRVVYSDIHSLYSFLAAKKEYNDVHCRTRTTALL